MSCVEYDKPVVGSEEIYNQEETRSVWKVSKKGITDTTDFLEKYHEKTKFLKIYNYFNIVVRKQL